MKLKVSGHCFRLTGTAEPFNQFEKEFADADSLLGKEEELPGGWFKIQRQGKVFLIDCSVEGIEKQIPLTEGQENTIRVERTVLGVEITFSLKG